MRQTEQETRASLARLHRRWSDEEKAAADPHDAAVTRAIEDVLQLQERDPDSGPADKRVTSLLKQALAAQHDDNAEG